MGRTIRVLSVALLTIVGLVGTALPARADDRNDRDERRSRCERRVHDAEAKLQDAIQRYGEDSRRARHRRDQLEQARRDCPDYRGEHHDMEHHDMEHHDEPH